MPNVWKIAPDRDASDWDNCRKHGYIALGWAQLRDFGKFKSEEEILKALGGGIGDGKGAAKSIWRFATVVQQSEVVVANKGKTKVVGIGVVSSDYLPPNHRKNPSQNEGLPHARLIDWRIDQPIDLEPDFFGIPVIYSLNAEKVGKIKEAYRDKYPELRDTLDQLFPSGQSPEQPSSLPPGVKMKALLEQFGQVILYGPPGTGKTREAKRVALALLTGKDSKADTKSSDNEIEEQLKPFRDAGRFDIVVFHPAYEYEQFVGGIEPNLADKQLSFHPKEGAFLRLCRNAENDKRPAVLIIDEINRGNLPKLLGELVYALEYREHKVTLPFACGDGRTDLIVPKNLYVIATMNSADRSIGHIDVAIRRRFGLFRLGASPNVVRERWANAGDKRYGERLADLMKELNKILHSGHDPDGSSSAFEMGVGHSYFLPAQEASGKIAKQQVQMKWEYQVRPLLEEYVQLLNLGGDSLAKFRKSLDQCMHEQ